MNRKRMALWALVGSSVCAAACSGAADSAAASAPASAAAQDSSASSAQIQDEIIVEAHREKLSQLRVQIAKSEDAFFDAYNHLNTVREFDVHCGIETALGTHISKRECRPEFVDDARETATEDSLDSLLALGDGRLEPARGPGANQLTDEKLHDYRQHLLELASKDAGLRKMLKEYDALRKHYEAVRKEKLHGKLIYFGD